MQPKPFIPRNTCEEKHRVSPEQSDQSHNVRNLQWSTLSALFCFFESIANNLRTWQSEANRMAAHDISARATGPVSRKRCVSEMGNPGLPSGTCLL